MKAKQKINRWSNPRNYTRQAFTLTDLLVTMAGVSLLLAIGLPVLFSTRAKARLATCSNNLGKIGKATLSYAAENRQRLPASTPGEGHNVWWWYKEKVKSHAGLNGSSSPADTLFACPDDRGYTDPIPFHASERFDYNSYPFNGVNLPGMPNIAGLSVSAVNNPAKTLLVMEWTAHAPLSWHASQTGRKNSPFYNNAKSMVAFVDGHVKFIPIYYDGYNAAHTQDPIAGYEYQFSAK